MGVTMSRRSAWWLSLVFLALGPVATAAAAAGSRRAATLVESGNEAFAAGRYAEALDQYYKAQVEDPLNPVIQYDIGNALYKLGQYDKAQQAFDAVKGGVKGEDQGAKAPVDLSRDGAYNQGGSLFQTQKYKEALEQYQRALELDPTDKDAKHNLELARLKLMKPPPPPPPPAKKPEEKQEDKKSEDEKKPPPQASPSPSPSATPQPKPGEMSKDEASRLLDALDRAEHDERKADKKAAASENEAIDW